jgi:Zn-dependent membrane protease YugP
MIAGYLTISINIVLYMIYRIQLSKIKSEVTAADQTGEQRAWELIDIHKLNIGVEDGKRSQYDWLKRVIKLASEHRQDTLKAVAVATHECAHAFQAKNKTALSIIRALLYIIRIPVLSLLIVGYFNSWATVTIISIILFWMSYFAALIHEIDANRFAKAWIREMAAYSSDEKKRMKQVLMRYQFGYVVNVLSVGSLVFYVFYTLIHK